MLIIEESIVFMLHPHESTAPIVSLSVCDETDKQEHKQCSYNWLSIGI